MKITPVSNNQIKIEFTDGSIVEINDSTSFTGEIHIQALGTIETTRRNNYTIDLEIKR